MTTKAIFDTSALLALINKEPGYEIVQQHLSSAAMSTINIAEIVTYLVRNEYNDEVLIKQITNLVKHINVNSKIAVTAGTFVKFTKDLGLSLGDRICLATALELKVPVYTADRDWSKVANLINISIIQIRS